ncbi:uncharacterized protein TNCV_1933471 [Trichonephila clavipes]|nr:uncharacterized protein TNCV_1933471 [Trichonephila clavipes]
MASWLEKAFCRLSFAKWLSVITVQREFWRKYHRIAPTSTSTRNGIYNSRKFDSSVKVKVQGDQVVRQEILKEYGKTYTNCDENKTVVNTSLKSVQTSHDVNLRITQAFSHIGKGYSAIEKFCMVMNIDPFSSTTYGKCARRLDNAYTLASENIFAEIHREIKNVYENGAEIIDLSVSFDGTWLTRGHTSLIGVGYVVDFEVMKKVYGPDIVIKKEECINHVSKRLGTALRSTVKDCRAQGISLGGKAHGNLKEATIKKLTTYYQMAILRNKGDVNAMKTAIYATLLHSISTDAKPKHSKCPAGENSWCF